VNVALGEDYGSSQQLVDKNGNAEPDVTDSCPSYLGSDASARGCFTAATRYLTFQRVLARMMVQAPIWVFLCSTAGPCGPALFINRFITSGWNGRGSADCG
jgi:hypothetical protein